jgi:hypothetical protein
MNYCRNANEVEGIKDNYFELAGASNAKIVLLVMQ